MFDDILCGILKGPHALGKLPLFGTYSVEIDGRRGWQRVPHPPLNKVGRYVVHGCVYAETVPEPSATGHWPRYLRLRKDALDFAPGGYPMDRPDAGARPRAEPIDHSYQRSRYGHASEHRTSPLQCSKSHGAAFEVQLFWIESEGLADPTAGEGKQVREGSNRGRGLSCGLKKALSLGGTHIFPSSNRIIDLPLALRLKLHSRPLCNKMGNRVARINFRCGGVKSKIVLLDPDSGMVNAGETDFAQRTRRENHNAKLYN